MYSGEERLACGLCRFGTSLTWVNLEYLLSFRVNLTLLKSSPFTWLTSLSFLLASFTKVPGINLVQRMGWWAEPFLLPVLGIKRSGMTDQLRIAIASGWCLVSLWSLCPKSSRCLSTLCDIFAGLDACQPYSGSLSLDFELIVLLVFAQIFFHCSLQQNLLRHCVILASLSHTLWRPFHKCSLRYHALLGLSSRLLQRTPWQFQLWALGRTTLSTC